MEANQKKNKIVHWFYKMFVDDIYIPQRELEIVYRGDTLQLIQRGKMTDKKFLWFKWKKWQNYSETYLFKEHGQWKDLGIQSQLKRYSN